MVVHSISRLHLLVDALENTLHALPGTVLAKCRSGVMTAIVADTAAIDHDPHRRSNPLSEVCVRNANARKVAQVNVIALYDQITSWTAMPLLQYILRIQTIRFTGNSGNVMDV